MKALLAAVAIAIAGALALVASIVAANRTTTGPGTTADHSSMSVIRDRLGVDVLDAIHVVLLRALRAHGLLRGRKLGIDSSVIEANASLRALEHRNSEDCVPRKRPPAKRSPKAGGERTRSTKLLGLRATPGRRSRHRPRRYQGRAAL